MPAQPSVLRVALPVPLPRLFDYLPPAGTDAATVAAGQRVRVPFGKREAVAIVLGHAEAEPGVELRQALALPDPQPLLQGELLASLRWLAGYLHAPIGEVLATALPAALRRGVIGKGAPVNPAAAVEVGAAALRRRDYACYRHYIQPVVARRLHYDVRAVGVDEFVRQHGSGL